MRLKRRVLVQNALRCLPGRQVVQDNRDWDPGASEADGAVHDLRVCGYEGPPVINALHALHDNTPLATTPLWPCA